VGFLKLVEALVLSRTVANEAEYGVFRKESADSM
jgi:hypothetical protein